MSKFEIGQMVKNKVTKVLRRITKVGKYSVKWESKDGKKKGECLNYTMTRWTRGKS